MTEPIVEEPVVEEPKTDVVVKTDKQFSQEQVDKIVQDRLAREKLVSTKLKDDFEAYKVSVEAELTIYKALVEKQIAADMKDIPDSIKKLLDKLTPAERLEWLADPNNLINKERKSIPSSPKSNLPEKKIEPNKVGRIL